jgi:hypothetical protein
MSLPLRCLQEVPPVTAQERGVQVAKQLAADRWAFIEAEARKAIDKLAAGVITLGGVVAEIEVALRARGSQFAIGRPRRMEEPRYPRTEQICKFLRKRGLWRD